MKNTTRKIGKQCIRGKCKELVYTKSAYAKQLGLCKNHFHFFTNKYMFCNFCGSWVKKKGGLYCNKECATLDKICISPHFKSFDSIVSKILFKMPPEIQKIFLTQNLRDIFTEYLQVEQIQNLDSLKNIEPNNQHQYISALKSSFFYSHTKILGLYYFIVPSVIFEGTKTDGLLLSYLKSNYDKNSFRKIFEIAKNDASELLKIKLDFPKKDLYSYVVCYSNDDPCYQLPILSILNEFLDIYCHSDFFDETANENTEYLLTVIGKIKILNSNGCDYDDTLEMRYIFTEVCALILLYTLVNYDQLECQVAFKKLSMLFVSSEEKDKSIEFHTTFNWYFNLWLEKKFPAYPNFGLNSKGYYRAFYQSLFSIYKQELIQIVPENISTHPLTQF